MKRLPIACLIALAFTSPALAGTDWGKECASYGLTVGSADYKDCVAKMSDADKATGGTMGQDMKNNGGNSGAQTRANADKQRAQMQADMDKQRAQMQADMNQQMQAAKNNPKCKTVTNGTNTVTQCP